jgi:hypothetical protein
MTGLMFNPETMKIESYDETREFHFGDEIQVKLLLVDFLKMRLEFELI